MVRRGAAKTRPAGVLFPHKNTGAGYRSHLSAHTPPPDFFCCYPSLRFFLTLLRARGAVRPWFRSRRGLSRCPLARAGDLGPNEDSPLAGTWQVAFLGEIEPRAARPGMHAPASETSRPAPASAVKSPRWHALSHGGGTRCLEVLRDDQWQKGEND
jgi:hypothetical protein